MPSLEKASTHLEASNTNSDISNSGYSAHHQEEDDNQDEYVIQRENLLQLNQCHIYRIGESPLVECVANLSSLRIHRFVDAVKRGVW